MKRDKVLKIGYDGHSEFITIETDNHGGARYWIFASTKVFTKSIYLGPIVWRAMYLWLMLKTPSRGWKLN